MKNVKKSKELTDRRIMIELGRSERTLADYAKVTPLQPSKSTPNIIQNYRNKR